MNQESLIELPSGPFNCILADPPWRFRTWNEENQAKAASRYYDLMDTEAIKRMPVSDVAADDCVLFLWAVNPMLPQALEVMEAWGFKFKTVAFTWAKRSTTGKAWHVGLGYWSRQNTEQVLLGVRGKPKRIAKDVRQLIVTPRREHSRKPEELYSSIERLVDGPRLELFSRTKRPGWASWGNETDKFEAIRCEPAVLN